MPRILKLPPKLAEKLSEDEYEAGAVQLLLSKFEPILANNKLEFFPEFTDHGFQHIKDVFEMAEKIITDESWNFLCPKDISVLVQAILLHDLGMHLNSDMFSAMVETKHIVLPSIDNRCWAELWAEFLEEALRFSHDERVNILGTRDKPRKPEFSDLSETDRRLIGEFIRRNHPRLCHEISVGSSFLFFDKPELDHIIDYQIRDLAGFAGRSHGMSLRETFPYLTKRYKSAWKNPYNVKIVYLMAVLRIADYLQVQRERAPGLLYKIRLFKSPLSKNEWDFHNSIRFLIPTADDPERVYIHCEPRNSSSFVKIKRLLDDIQDELDKSWAVLGEVYSSTQYSKLALKYRRLNSNIYEGSDDFDFIPQRINFTCDPNVLKLLIKPLYSNDVSSGIREMIQNSLDACKERELLDDDYKPFINLKIESSNENFYFIIEDNGIGMNRNILINYFFSIGRSFRDSRDWVRQYTNEDQDALIVRTGRFGIGALASFLLGDEVELVTRHMNAEEALTFRTSYSEESIEVLCKKQGSIGTTIKIKLYPELCGILNSAIKYRDKLDWFSLYVADNPLINFTFDEQLIPVFSGHENLSSEPFFPSSSPYWRRFSKDDLVYYWTFNQQILDKCYKTLSKRVERYSDSDQGPYQPLLRGTLSCNGFHIRQGYSVKELDYCWVPPRVAVLDRNGSLELSLDRHSVYNNSLPNEREFLVDICKEIVATLFALDFDELRGLKRIKEGIRMTEAFNIKEHIYCNGDGYVLNTFSILNILGVETLIHFWLVKGRTDDLNDVLGSRAFYRVIDEVGSDYSQHYKTTHFSMNQSARNGLIFWFSPYSHSRNAKRDVKVDQYPSRYLFDSEDSPKRDIMSSHKGQDSIWDLRSLDVAYSSFDKAYINQDALKGSIESFLAIQMSRQRVNGPMHVRNKQTEFWLLREVLFRYLGDRMVIPFDFTQRKQQYTMVFEELGDRINGLRT